VTPEQRKASIEHMPRPVREELLGFMSSHRTSNATSKPVNHEDKKTKRQVSVQVQDRQIKQQMPVQVKGWSRGTDVRTIQYAHQKSYQAQMRIRHLRMYTRIQTHFQTAISHQIVLIQMQLAINEAGEQVWEDPVEFGNVFRKVLRVADTSQEELGLSVFIFMHADEWIRRPAVITSPVLNIETVVAIHERLLVARKISWAKLRAEWVVLMRQTQHGRLHELSQAQAEAMADKARSGLVQQRMRQAISAAWHAIKRCHHLEQRGAKAAVKLQHRAAKGQAAAAALQKRTQRELCALRQRWSRRNDLTMDEIMQGPPGQP